MKKVLLIVAAVIVVLAIAPIVGSKVIESKLDENINKLSSSGLEIIKQESKSGYINTSKHYEFVINDSKKLAKYISEISNQDISPYSDVFLNGSVVGVDLESSNIPLLKSTSVDIYPISLSESAIKDIKQEDQAFAEYIENFLEKKALVYHVDYDILSKNFEGYIKDIKESYTNKDDHRIDFELTGSKFYGNGNVIAPRFISSRTKKINLYFTDSSDEFNMDVENLSVSSSFESITSYSSNINMQGMDIDIKSKNQEDSKINVKDLKFGFASNTDGKKAKFYSKSSFEKIYIDAKNESINIKNFNFDSILSDIDKDSYEELNNLLRSGANFNSTSVNYKMQKIIQEIFLRGFTLDLKDISVDNINFDGNNDLGKSFANAKIKLPQNVVKNSINTTELINKIGIDMLIDISKPMFEMITRTTPLVSLSQRFAKVQTDSLVFDIKVKDGSITVNGKKVK